MEDEFCVGAAFRYDDGINDDHPRVVISSVDEPDVVLVNLTDARNHSDKSCILTVGDHDCIYKESCIAYAYAEVEPLASLKRAMSQGALRLYKPMRPEIVIKIWAGAEATSNLPERCRLVLVAQSLIPDRPQMLW